ncbi:MotA/TolQ/ExbB proton channel family protein [Tundrisphaera sp. TA3]|uniref:MotA/TolQ/ExbB proton channel family protein n=1 Tax=Tundrisphaera sp. TA3 TaxID=3435775 RepID=UPI003EBBA625
MPSFSRPSPSALRAFLVAGLLSGVGASAAWAQAAPAAGEAARSGGFLTDLRWIAESSGLIGLVILVLSFYLIALIAWMAMEYRPSVALPRDLIRELNDLLALKQYTQAFEKVSESPSFFGKVLTAGVRKLPSGLAPAQKAMELANDDATMAMEHRTTYLATVGTLGPMIGLVGTVYGMILSFQVIATAGASPQASQLAKGISTALFATLEGIALSIPAIFFHALFRNRIARLSMEVAMLSETMLEQFAPGVRAPHPLAARPIPAAPNPSAND